MQVSALLQLSISAFLHLRASTCLNRRSRCYSDLTRDKCFIQMLLSHIVEEVMNFCLAAARMVHRVKPELDAGTAPQQQN